MKNRKTANWIIALLGLWEFGDILALVTPGFGEIHAFVWNHILAGFVLIILGTWAALTHRLETARTLDWIAAVIGGWLVAFPLLFGRPQTAPGLWNDVIVGVLAAILGMWAAQKAA
jgi:uncharacterized membrane protein HdeD (DUF308 family)